VKAGGRPVSCSAYSALKMEAIYSSETSVDFQRTTRRYIPVDSILRNHGCENLKSYVVSFLSNIVQYKQESIRMIIHTAEPDKECALIVPHSYFLPFLCSHYSFTRSPTTMAGLYDVRRWAPTDRTDRLE
jgi:hypothetical protein